MKKHKNGNLQKFRKTLGTSEDLFESPKQAYTKELLAASFA